MKSLRETHREGTFRIFMIYLQLGCVSFGGPVAHIGYFRDAFVVRLRWLSENEFSELIALCQSIPGPSSSQLGFAIGWLRGGFRGACAAWLGFTLPSALMMIGIGYGILSIGEGAVGSIDGLLAATVAIVVCAVLGMAKKMCPDLPRLCLAVLCATLAFLIPGMGTQLLVIIIGAVYGLAFCGKRGAEGRNSEAPSWDIRAIHPALWAVLFSVLLCASVLWPVNWAGAIYAKHFEAGALVFGGGHVVLPLLSDSVVSTGMIEESAFLAGYSAAQAMPGPLFALSAFNGTVATGGFFGGALSLIAIFLPGMLLVAVLLQSWSRLRRYASVQSALFGVNAAVVGLLLSALANPVWPKGITSWAHFGIAFAAFIALQQFKAPAWSVVLACGLLGLWI